MQATRIFISSPGDLAVERKVAHKVIERLKSEFGHRGILRCEMWENQPLLASDSFQSQIVPPEDCDIVVLMLWNRMGTPLPKEKGFRKADGSDYLSGTEFEYLSALAAHQENGKPQILVYKKELSPEAETRLIESLPKDEQSEALHQKQSLQDFIKDNFTAQDQSLTSAYHLFAEQDEFQQRLEAHLAQLLDNLLPEESQVSPQDLKQWHRGSPFVGLDSFSSDHAKVFFGRNQDIANLKKQLLFKAAKQTPFQVILGMSGCGKSSLAKAGLMPTICADNAASGVVHWRHLQMKPSEVESDLLLTFCHKLVAQNALPSLYEIYHKNLGELKQALLQQSPALLQHIQHAMAHADTGKSALFMILDQSEELFTHDLIKPWQVTEFAKTIQWLVQSQLVWCVMTLRADFYAQFTAVDAFAKLKSKQGQYDLHLPTEDEIGQIIRLPAKAAGLTFEIDEQTGESLYDQLRESASREREVLPLLQFSLEQLYLQRSSSEVLTLDAYHKMGGIEGALAQHAEQSFLQCSPAQQKAFSRLFNRLVDFDQAHENRFTRRVVSLEQIKSKHAKQLAQALIEQRLLVLSLQNNQSYVGVAHESIFEHWPRLKRWIGKNKENIAIRQKLLEVSTVWLKEGKPINRLYAEGKLAEEAKQLQHSGLAIEGAIEQFIQASQRKIKRFTGVKYAGLVALFILTIATTYTAIQAQQEKATADRRLTQSEELVSYMLTDLRKQLEPIGKLDILGKAGEATVNYFRQLPSEDLSETNLTNKARALYQLGEVQFGLGDINKAKQFFSESFATSQALLKKNPTNQTMLFEHAQAAFWVGYMEFELANHNGAINYFERYLDAAKQLVTLDSENADYWIELGSAYANIGGVYQQLDRLDEAEEVLKFGIAQFDNANNLDEKTHSLEQLLVQINSLLANVYASKGSYIEEQNIRRKSIAILASVIANNSKDFNTELLLYVEMKNLGLSLYKAGKNKEAANKFEQLINELKHKESLRHDLQQVLARTMVDWYELKIVTNKPTDELKMQIERILQLHRNKESKVWEKILYKHNFLKNLEHLYSRTLPSLSCEESFNNINTALLSKRELLQLNVVSIDICYANQQYEESERFIAKAESLLIENSKQNAFDNSLSVYLESLKNHDFKGKAQSINNPLVAKRLNQLATYKE